MNTDCVLEYSQLRATTGQYLTQGLFYEFRHRTSCSDIGPYNLKEHDFKGSLSMYQIYMSCASEYEAAQKLLGSWKHWAILCEIHWFKKHLETWREEREIKEAAVGKATILYQAKEGNVTAAKELVSLATKRKAGRPSKLEIEAEKKKQIAIESNVTNLLAHVKKNGQN